MRRLRPFLLLLASAAGCSIGGLALHLSATLGGTPGPGAFEGPAQAEAAAPPPATPSPDATPATDAGIIANQASAVATPTPASAAAPRSCATTEPSEGYTTVPLTGRPVCMRFTAAACSSSTS
jgi:hypothetical protein